MRLNLRRSGMETGLHSIRAMNRAISLYLKAPALAGLLIFCGLSHAVEAVMVTYPEFSRWTPNAKMEYIRDFRTAVTQLELDAHDWQVVQAPATREPLWLHALQLLLPKASANASNQCLVGGWLRQLVPGPGGTSLCPTSGKPCDGRGDQSFQCGTIYNNRCVPRYPVQNLTLRCHTAAGDQIPTQLEYEDKKAFIDRILSSCHSNSLDQRFKENCDNFRKRTRAISQRYSASESEQAPVAQETAPELPPRVCRPPRIVRIHADMGGRIDKFEARAHDWKREGARIEIHGECSSACTLYAGMIPRERVCVGPKAKLGFHQAWYHTSYGPRNDPVETARMVRKMPPEVQDWVSRRRLSSELVYLKGSQLHSIYQSCDSLKARCERRPAGTLRSAGAARSTR